MTLAVIFTIFIVKMLDPIMAGLSIVAGIVSRAWWHVAVSSILIASIIEVILSTIQLTRQFRPGEFLLGTIAAGTWAALAFWIKQRKKRAKDSKVPNLDQG